jgi:hypothetical protein
MRHQTPFVIAALAAAMLLASCGGTSTVAPTGDKAASVTQPQTKQVSQPTTKVPSASSLSMPKDLKKVLYQKVGAGPYPVQFWFDSLGIHGQEYWVKVNVVNIHSVSHLALILSRDDAHGLVPRIVSGGVKLKSAASGGYMVADFAGSSSDSASFTVAYPKKLAQPNSCVSVQGWRPASDAGADLQVSNGRLFCPSTPALSH